METAKPRNKSQSRSADTILCEIVDKRNLPRKMWPLFS